jgi:NUMOD1 domain
VFKSNFSESQIYETLYSKLKAKQGNLNFKNKYIGILIYLYNYNNNLISSHFIKYDSINTLSRNINVGRDTIKKYLNTHVPYNNNLYYTYVLNDFNLINGLISEAKKELVLQPTKSTKV